MATSLRTACVPLAGAILVALLQVVPRLGGLLEYRRTLLDEQPWRMLSAHWVHITWPHALINALALMIVARLFDDELTARRQAAVVLTSSLVIGVGLAILWPSVAWYRGLSGVIHALYFAGAAVWLSRDLQDQRVRYGALVPTVLLVGGWIKVLLEQAPAEAVRTVAWLGAAVVPQAHLLGGVAGNVLGAIFAFTEARAGSRRAAS